MFNAFDLVFGQGWIQSLIKDPMAAGPGLWLTASAVVAFVAAIVLAIVRRERAVGWVLVSFGLSQLLVILASVFAGQLEQPSLVLGTFAVGQAVLIIAMFTRSRRSRLAAVLAGWFSVIYALFAGFLSLMVFSGGFV